MSEPVIKPRAMWCHACGGFTPGEWHFEHAKDVVLQPLYTRDDLVRVARECNRLWDESTAFDDEIGEATRVVDRLTKGET